MEILTKFKEKSEKGEISDNPKVPTRQEIETLVESVTNTLITRFKERGGKEFLEKVSSETNNTQKNEQTQNIPQEINNVSVQGANNTTPINANHINMNNIVSDIIDRVNSLEPISLSDYQ